ncbi:uncharacterized protein LOC116193164 [Punica granatum]|uniref:Thioredoxin-like fold domain-containing protein n=2 Tax=Punica granatum TaxID=22663 RepID=A0A218X7N8_PUNGR|nr:uncharacterized protein LOC116193164 [Punica granatum]OWM80943.1 hypothetical protein CDL15_Pgr006974 [Punica granatum]PKI45630.1 hypothetical protein CRG98_033946 [Punica granatum]
MARPESVTRLLSLVFFVTVGFSAIRANSQSLPPARPDGFVYSTDPVGPETIIIEAFLDPVCPDSRDAWWPLKKALDYYGPHVWLVVHLLPLPYHDNAYVASRALHIVNSLNSSATFHLLELFFKQQEKFYNDQTLNLSKASIVRLVAKFATQAVGNSFYSAIEQGFNDRRTDLKTRVSFKYSTSKGVSATPTFFLNGFVLPHAGSPIDFEGWKSYIDPLIGASSDNGDETLHYFL